jgi:hypothetical protein
MKPPHPLVRPPRHKWFSADDIEADGWWGPHDTIEEAARDCILNSPTGCRIFVAHGYKLLESERYAEYPWEVDAHLAFEIVLPDHK